MMNMIRAAIIAVAALIPSLAQAQTTFEQFGTYVLANPVASVLNPNDVLYVNQGGVSKAILGSTLSTTLPTVGPGQILSNYTSASAPAAAGNWMFASVSCPTSSLSTYQMLMNVNGAPTNTLMQVYDGTQCVQWGALNSTAHTITLTSAVTTSTVTATNVNVGDAAQTGGNWITTGGWDTIYQFPTVNALRVVSPSAARAIGAYCRQSDIINVLLNCQTVVTLTLIDQAPSPAGSAWGKYNEIDVTATGAAAIFGEEADVYSLISNTLALAASMPGTFNATGHTSVFRAAAGAGRTSPFTTSNNISTAFEVIQNLSTFEVGFLCGSASLDTAGGRIGQCITMDDNQAVSWYVSSSGSGGQGSSTFEASIYAKFNSFAFLNFNVATGGAIQLEWAAAAIYGFNATTQYPVTDNTITQGGPSNRYVNIYSILGTFTGEVTITSTGTLLSATGANTNGSNSILVNNSGTSTGSNTTQSFFEAQLGSVGFVTIGPSWNGGFPIALLSTSAGLTSGLDLVTAAGPITLNPNAGISFQNSSVAVGDFGFTAGNRWTFAGTAGVTINVATGIMLDVVSSNTGAANSIYVENSGTVATANTAADVLANLSAGSSAFIQMIALGGATPVGKFATGAGLTGGMQVLAVAGPVVINPATTLQFQSAGTPIGDYGLTVPSTWTFAAPTNITGTIKVSAIAANTGAQTGYLCYNTTGGVITYDATNTCLVSSARYKENIQALSSEAALAEILQLNPASFNRRAQYSPDTAPRLGLIAEDVAAVDERLVVRDADGLPRGVLYETGGVTLLIGAVKALKADNDNLRAKVEALKTGTHR